MSAPVLAPGEDARPGRNCPLSYRYSPRVFRGEPQLAAETLYVAGGLYGNVEALEALLELVAAEPGAKLVFNGDFHWFDVDAADFARIDDGVLVHAALRGNVETEIAQAASGAGCGCAYPAEVADDDVERSNRILERLREAAAAAPARRERLARLPMHLTARVGDGRIGIVHGDASSLAGWGFAHDRLGPARARWLASAFRESGVDIFASSHTCLPAMRSFAWDGARGLVANNGAAGMPNFAGETFGLATRISVRPSGAALYRLAARGLHVEAVPIRYDHARWVARFQASWPPGSPAHRSYFRRIAEGPRFSTREALAA